jgi:pilus assembly protein Flp/PilA
MPSVSTVAFNSVETPRLYCQLSSARSVQAERVTVGKELDMKNLLNRFVRDESGATAIEYGLIAALIAVVLITVLGLVGTRLQARFQEVADALQ